MLRVSFDDDGDCRPDSAASSPVLRETQPPKMSQYAQFGKQFKHKKLNIGCYVNKFIIRDDAKRKAFQAAEPERQALRYIIANTTLPQRTRAIAQLQLSQMHCYTRPTQIKNRCTMGGIGRSVMRAFKISRYNFRMEALAGNLPGVKKASW